MSSGSLYKFPKLPISETYWDLEFRLAKLADRYSVTRDQLIGNLNNYSDDIINEVMSILDSQEQLLGPIDGFEERENGKVIDFQAFCP